MLSPINYCKGFSNVSSPMERNKDFSFVQIYKADPFKHQPNGFEKYHIL